MKVQALCATGHVQTWVLQGYGLVSATRLAELLDGSKCELCGRPIRCTIMEDPGDSRCTCGAWLGGSAKKHQAGCPIFAVES